MIRALFYLTALALAVSDPLAAVTDSIETERLYLSGRDASEPRDWQFFVDRGAGAGTWTSVPVPANWEMHGFGRYAYGLEEQSSDEVGYYRASFVLPESWRGRRLRLVFEGVMTDTAPRLNGKLLPIHRGGFTEFGYEISEQARFGEPNLLEVTVRERSTDPSINAAERSADYWVFGGIYRPVYVEARPAAAVVAVRPRADAGGRLRVALDTLGASAGSRVQLRLLDYRGAAIETAAGERLTTAPVFRGGAWFDLVYSGVESWSSETPTLYWLEVMLVDGNGKITHRARERIGFSTVALGSVGAPGLRLNGRRILLRGVNRHSSRPSSAHALSRRQNREDVRLIRALGFNAVRTAHSPPDRAFLDACDELGLYVIDEVPGWHSRYRTRPGRVVVRELVSRDVGRPSVLLWSNGNEGGWNRRLDAELVRLDPRGRPVIHPEATFGGFDAVHYPSYAELEERLREGKRSGQRPAPLVLPTEWLHALDHGGGGAGLASFWDLVRQAPRGAGGFIWSLVDEGIERVDQGGVIDTFGNHARDGILGVDRRWGGDAFAVREILAPVQLARAAWQKNEATLRLEVENRSDFLSLDRYRLRWCESRLPGPLESATAEQGGCGTFALPAAEPGATASIEIARPGSLVTVEGGPVSETLGATVLDLIVELSRSDDSSPEIVNHWSVPLPFDDESLVVTEPQSLATADGGAVELSAGGLTAGLSGLDGDLLYLERDGVRLRLDRGRPVGRHADRLWQMTGDGWLLLTVPAEDDGLAPYAGIELPIDTTSVRSFAWLGGGPGSVWGNRVAGARFGVWQAGASGWPELSGIRSGVRWARVETDRGALIVVPRVEPAGHVAGAPFVSILAPRFADDALGARASCPEGLAVLWRAPEIGTKFRSPEELRPARSRAPVARPGARGRRAQVAFYWAPRFSPEARSATVSPLSEAELSSKTESK